MNVPNLSDGMNHAAQRVTSWAPSVGLILVFCTVLALCVQNLVFPSYAEFWQQPLSLSLGDYSVTFPLQKWINDGLLTLFFFVIGLELKNEILTGHLSTWKTAALPIAAAIGSMTIPAIIFHFLAPNEASHAWAIPLSADTAFTVALLAMIPATPPALRVFLISTMVVDDIFTVHIVGFIYSDSIHVEAVAAAVLCVAGLVVLRALRVRNMLPYLLMGVVLWFFLHEGGIHANFAGILLAIFLPTKRRSIMDSHFMSHVSPNAMFVVLPLFALANSGVSITPQVFVGHEMLTAAIVLGLVFGKPIGLVGATYLVSKLGIAKLPDDSSWLQIIGVGFLCGIGFTMSLLIAERSLDGGLEDAAKLSVFLASSCAAIIGTVLLMIGWQEEPKKDELQWSGQS